MAKKKPKKEKKKEKQEKDEVDEVFNYKKYIEKTFTNPKTFIYYIIVNNITLKNKKEVDELYKKFNILGGN